MFGRFTFAEQRWRELTCHTTSWYFELFTRMENADEIDSARTLDMYALTDRVVGLISRAHCGHSSGTFGALANRN